MEKAPKEITIIIPTFKRDVLLQQTIDSLANCDFIEDCEIVIVNDCKESDVCVKLPKKLDIRICLNSGKGPGHARNFGASISKSSFLLFIDDDILLKKDAITKLLEQYSQNKGVCYSVNWTIPEYLTKIIEKSKFGKYLIKSGFTTLKGWMGNNARKYNWSDSVIEADSVAALFMFISREDFKMVGGFDVEAAFAFEDFLFSKKIEKYGGKMLIITEILVFHNEVDKMEPLAWLSRKETGARCRQELVAFGHNELALHYSLLKRIAYKVIYCLKKPLLFIATCLPCQSVYNYVFNLLFGSCLCRGYYNKK